MHHDTPFISACLFGLSGVFGAQQQKQIGVFIKAEKLSDF